MGGGGGGYQAQVGGEGGGEMSVGGGDVAKGGPCLSFYSCLCPPPLPQPPQFVHVEDMLACSPPWPCPQP